MDWLKHSQKTAELLKKYRYVLLIVLSGLILMAIPEQQAPKQQKMETQPVRTSVEQSLQEVLSLIHGAGKVAVLLTEKRGEETVYQTDEDIETGDLSENAQSRTVITTNSDREETGLVRQVNPPVLQGAVIVCQGGDDPKVKLAIVEAVMRATGLPSTCISVLKMK